MRQQQIPERVTHKHKSLYCCCAETLGYRIAVGTPFDTGRWVGKEAFCAEASELRTFIKLTVG